jgi:hypothetical protein
MGLQPPEKWAKHLGLQARIEAGCPTHFRAFCGNGWEAISLFSCRINRVGEPRIQPAVMFFSGAGFAPLAHPVENGLRWAG